ncbi:TetR/AcrR family transcriptional regulator [Arthrobacter sp. 9V]|uniref:TetR/AcrR family transcriptional regulator n=1 Tax=Arthrobacter sp. 9V TaxID=2653132 RepID=UPI0012F0AB97|nr:TetR/AcrR family transcriptional regulator [Arthrobacter sp. 9V]VXB37252.1 TetR/AcrR family transcriptional regulator [Arthrobacter sp. 9V]
MMETVKGPEATSSARRGYDASRRRQAAEASRQTVIDRARHLLLTQGFGGTTVTQVATASGVSSETIYKSFGGKAGLVRAIQQQSLLGSKQSAAEQRSELAQRTAEDPLTLMHHFGLLAAEVSPLVVPINLLIRDAALTGHSAMAALLQEVEEARHGRMLRNAQHLLDRGFLRADVSAEQAADVMFACTAPELFEVLVMKRGWTAEQFGSFIASTLMANLASG